MGHVLRLVLGHFLHFINKNEFIGIYSLKVLSNDNLICKKKDFMHLRKKTRQENGLLSVPVLGVQLLDSQWRVTKIVSQYWSKKI